MCLMKPKLMVNKKPIICYKVLRKSGPWFNRKLSAIVFDYNYFLGVTHVQPNKEEHITFLSYEPSLGGGYFHSFAKLGDAQTYVEYQKNKFFDNNLVVVECEIPAKTELFKGEFEYFFMKPFDSYASKVITIKRIIKK